MEGWGVERDGGADCHGGIEARESGLPEEGRLDGRLCGIGLLAQLLLLRIPVERQTGGVGYLVITWKVNKRRKAESPPDFRLRLQRLRVK